MWLNQVRALGLRSQLGSRVTGVGGGQIAVDSRQHWDRSSPSPIMIIENSNFFDIVNFEILCQLCAPRQTATAVNMGSGDLGGQDLSRRSSLKSSVMEFGVRMAGFRFRFIDSL